MIPNKPASVCSRLMYLKNNQRIMNLLLLSLTGLFLTSCGGANPQNVDVKLEKSAPVQKITSYSGALLDLGLMSEIYDTGVMKVQSQDITDETGTAVTTGGEIQRNITEIMKSTLNTIGGNVVFIEYDPAYIQNQMVSGYSNFDNKAIPDVVITGGITEFDRGLETRGKGMNADAEADLTGMPDWLPSQTVGASFGDTGKRGKARITLDFNLKDFQTLAGISRMTTTNSMEVYKGLQERELGITLFGPTFGLKGTIKKVQGRHEAVRLLVQVSMVQMIGKYLTLPYWRLLGDDSRPDKVVLDSISDTYYRMEPEDRIGAVQQWLTLHGYDVEINNKLDSKTQAALQKFDPALAGNGSELSEEMFSKIYLTIPITHKAYANRQKINRYFAQLQQSQIEEQNRAAAQAQAQAQAEAQAQAQAQQAQVQAQQAAAAAAAQIQQVAPEAVAQVQVEVAPEPVQQKVAPVRKQPKKFGRQLSAEDW